MLGQIRTVSELQPFTFDTFDLGHPVVLGKHTQHFNTKFYHLDLEANFIKLTKKKKTHLQMKRLVECGY